jgi:hypothetical protein
MEGRPLTDGELQRQLASVIVPGELEARRRSWHVVRSAFEERERLPRPRVGRSWPALALAGAVVVIAAAITPPGRSVLGELRDAIGREKDVKIQEQFSLFSLPTRGRLLVESARGAWIVRPDGAKRLLGTYDEASWSPFGRFVVASKADEVVALEPNGHVRWSIARRDVRHPRWSGTRTDTRIAYLSGRSLHVVGGDSKGDRVLVRRVAQVAPAWKPGSEHVLAFVVPAAAATCAASTPGHCVRVIDTDSRHVTAGWREPGPEQLAFSADGELVAARNPHALTVHTATGLLRAEEPATNRAEFVDIAFAPTHSSLAYVTYDASIGRSAVWTVDGGGTGRRRQLFEGTGRMTDVEWSPDERWLLAAWESADQWVFVRVGDGASKIVARSSITAQLNGGATDAPFPTIAGWCCP